MNTGLITCVGKQQRMHWWDSSLFVWDPQFHLLPPSTSFMCGIMITFQIVIMKRKFKQWWSTIPPISTKWTITSHLKHTKSPLIRRWISRSWFRIGTNMGGWTSKWDLNTPFLIIGSPMAIHCTYINNQYKTIYLQNCIYLCSRFEIGQNL